MSRRGGPSPVARFLGEEARARGPFGVLGLSPDRCPPDQVNAALDRQLDRVDQHPEGDTPEADEVRLALHAAAAQLLDPSVRQRLIERWSLPAPQATTSPAEDVEPQPVITPVVPGRKSRATRRTVMAVIFLMACAAVAGSLLLLVLDRRVRPGTAGPTATSSPSSTGTPMGHEPAGAGADAPAKPAASKPDKPRERVADSSSVVGALRACSADLRTKPEVAIASFNEAVAWLAASWPRLDLGQRRAANDAIVEFVYAAAKRPDGAGGIIGTIASGAGPLARKAGPLGAGEVLPGAWAAGMLSRLDRERDLPARTATQIDRALIAALGEDRPRPDSGFEAGAAAALVHMPLRLISPETDPGPSLRNWSAAVVALNPDLLVQERMVTDALEQLLVAGPEPDADQGAFTAVQTLALSMKWRRNGPARARLLEWFRDTRVSAADLHVLTSALANASGAEGVLPTMVLTANPGRDERDQLRTAYAAAWSIANGPDSDAGLSSWAEAAARLLDRTLARSGSDDENLAAAVEMARLNQAARIRWSGDALAAAMIVRSAEDLLNSMQATARPMPTGAITILGGGLRSGESQWAVSYLSAGQNIPVRLERLAELDRNGSALGPVDAAVLIEAACFAQGGDGRVRAAAQKVAGKHAREPVIVYSMLEVLPRAPRIESVSHLIAGIAVRDLPGVGDPAWMLHARRALVERLIEQLAGTGQTASIDQLSELLLLADSPRDSDVAPPSGTPTGSADAPPELTTIGIESLWKLLRAEAEPLIPNRAAPVPLTLIESRRTGRRALAAGPIQAWAAEQVSLAELLAFVVTGEQPASAPRAAAIIDDMMRERRGSQRVFEQIKVTERAMLRLWLLRYGKEAVWRGN